MIRAFTLTLICTNLCRIVFTGEKADYHRLYKLQSSNTSNVPPCDSKEDGRLYSTLRPHIAIAMDSLVLPPSCFVDVLHASDISSVSHRSVLTALALLPDTDTSIQPSSWCQSTFSKINTQRKMDMTNSAKPTCILFSESLRALVHHEQHEPWFDRFQASVSYTKDDSIDAFDQYMHIEGVAPLLERRCSTQNPTYVGTRFTLT
jgi:hypothetical protein